MLEIKNLKASINNKTILKGLNLTIKPGELHAIMGPNGSGKSTLAHVLSGKCLHNKMMVLLCNIKIQKIFSKFKRYEVVWARSDDYPWWPAKVECTGGTGGGMGTFRKYLRFR